MSREARKKVKAAKEECIEQQCKNIEKAMMTGNSKEATTPLRLSPTPSSISQQSSKAAEESS